MKKLLASLYIAGDKVNHFFWFTLAVWAFEMFGAPWQLTAFAVVLAALLKELFDLGYFTKGVKQGRGDIVDFLFGILPLGILIIN
ncbi:MAG: hypothetical protein OCD03_02905 [Hyphomicrobiales bacterium]